MPNNMKVVERLANAAALKVTSRSKVNTVSQRTKGRNTSMQYEESKFRLGAHRAIQQKTGLVLQV